MSIQKLAEALGIKKAYPEALNLYYPIPEERRRELCSREMIVELQEKLGVFGPYYDLVLEGFEEVKKDPMKRDWIDAVALCIKDGDVKNARKMTYPPTDGTLGGDMLPLYAVLPSVSDGYAEYLRRGFPEEHAKETMDGIRENIRVVEEHVLGRPGSTDTYANWLGLYIKTRIFYHRGLNYEIHTAPSYNPYILRNKKSGEIVPVFGKEFPVHKSGRPLGSSGATEEEGSFIASFEETEDAYIGHPADADFIAREKSVYPKADWEIAHAPGDHDISVHIPRKTDFSPETVKKSMEEALELVNRCYPEWKPKAIFCSSWLLSPVL
ncbi:MAG: hypothetical protein IKC69_01935, partial [Clostridia bacterium]|nr:hypothetical protein [Clostridia bacterium]